MSARSTLWLVALFASGCASTGRFDRSLPPYTSDSLALFDDSVEPAAVGLDFDGSWAPSQDAQLKQRIFHADAIVRARVDSVSSLRHVDADETRYTLHLTPLGTVHGKYAPEEPFVQDVVSHSYTLGTLDHLQGKLVGESFIALIKDFRPPGGPAESHLHLTADTPAVDQLIADVLAYGPNH